MDIGLEMSAICILVFSLRMNLYQYDFFMHDIASISIVEVKFLIAVIPVTFLP